MYIREYILHRFSCLSMPILYFVLDCYKQVKSEIGSAVKCLRALLLCIPRPATCRTYSRPVRCLRRGPMGKSVLADRHARQKELTSQTIAAHSRKHRKCIGGVAICTQRCEKQELHQCQHLCSTNNDLPSMGCDACRCLLDHCLHVGKTVPNCSEKVDDGETLNSKHSSLHA